MAKCKRLMVLRQLLTCIKKILMKYKRNIIAVLVLAIIVIFGTGFVLVKNMAEPALKVEEKVEKSLSLMKRIAPETATEEQVQSVIAEGMQIKEWSIGLKDERGYIIPLIVSVLIALCPLIFKVNKNVSNSFLLFLVLSFSLPLICTAAFILSTTYFTVGSTFDRVNDMYDESQNLVSDFEARAAAIKKAMDSQNSVQPPITTNPESPEPEQPKPFILNLNDPYWEEYFSSTPDDLADINFLVQCLELSYVSYPNPQLENPYGYSDKLVDAFEDEDTYFNYFVPSNKYIKPQQDDRFIFIGRAINYRLDGERLYGSKDDSTYEWYAPSNNRQAISNNYGARGLEYYHLRNEWIKALADWEEAIIWQCRTLRALITEGGTSAEKLKACNTIIHLYQEEIGSLESKSGIDSEIIIRTKIIIDTYVVFRDGRGW